MKHFPVILFSIGCFFLFLALIAGWIIIPWSITPHLDVETKLINGSILWDGWKNPEIYLKAYYFNVTNPSEVEAGEKPLLQEVGPYVYKENKFKRIVRENPEGGTITYADSIYYYFIEELSAGKESDPITVLNVPYTGISQQLSSYPSIIRIMALAYIKQFQQTVFVQNTVGEFFFTGTYLPLIHELERLTMQEMLPNSTFAIFFGKNGTEIEGEVEIYTGVKEPSKTGNIISWNKKTELRHWEQGSHCNMIKGSDGTLFPPLLTKESKLDVYNPDICRSIYATYKTDVEVKGIAGYRFTFPPETLARDNPYNECFCTEENREDCPKDGAYQIKSCQKDAPLLLSHPYFVHGDSEYSSKMGLIPNDDLHENQFNLEPTTGIVLSFNKRVQLSADVKRLSHISKLKKIQTMVLPMFWGDEVYIISDENAALLRASLATDYGVLHSIKWFALGSSLLLVLSSLLIFVIRVKRKPVFI